MQNLTLEQKIFLKDVKKNKKIIELPGKLESQASIILQTRIAQGYFKGNHKNSPGLFKFSSSMLQIREASAKDDPYADLILLKVERALDKLKKKIQKLQIEFQKKLEVGEDIEILPSISIHPIKIPLRFGSPYGFQGALLLNNFDHLARQALTSHYFGLTENPGKLFRELGSTIRQLFSIPQQWHTTGVTRQDVLRNNDLALKAQEIMPDLDIKILHTKIRARYSKLKKTSY